MVTEMTILDNAKKNNKRRRLSKKTDLFDNRIKKRSRRSKSESSSSQMYEGMVLTAEQMTAIAKSMLERQAKPKKYPL
jgi:hypothetical protein